MTIESLSESIICVCNIRALPLTGCVSLIEQAEDIALGELPASCLLFVALCAWMHFHLLIRLFIGPEGLHETGWRGHVCGCTQTAEE